MAHLGLLSTVYLQYGERCPNIEHRAVRNKWLQFIIAGVPGLLKCIRTQPEMAMGTSISIFET